MKNEKHIWRVKFLGLNDVDWNKYDFHLTPVLTYTKITRGESIGKCIALEWGHWAFYIGRFKLILQ
jgi:hypothetical protein